MNCFRQLFTRRQIYSDLEEEIQQHLEEKVDALMAQGMNREDSEYAAKREFGNVTRIEEAGREAWMWRKWEGSFTMWHLPCANGSDPQGSHSPRFLRSLSVLAPT
jgi:hypothetical protein